MLEAEKFKATELNLTITNEQILRKMFHKRRSTKPPIWLWMFFRSTGSWFTWYFENQTVLCSTALATQKLKLFH